MKPRQSTLSHDGITTVFYDKSSHRGSGPTCVDRMQILEWFRLNLSVKCEGMVRLTPTRMYVAEVRSLIPYVAIRYEMYRLGMYVRGP